MKKLTIVVYALSLATPLFLSSCAHEREATTTTTTTRETAVTAPAATTHTTTTRSGTGY